MLCFDVPFRCISFFQSFASSSLLKQAEVDMHWTLFCFQSFHGGNAVVLQYQLREFGPGKSNSQFGCFVDFEAMTSDEQVAHFPSTTCVYRATFLPAMASSTSIHSNICAQSPVRETDDG
jgi:hypothetical protein